MQGAYTGGTGRSIPSPVSATATATDGDSEAALDAWLPPSDRPVEAEVDAEARHATMRNHTATHLLHAALRETLGDHVRQAGSAVRPDKLRFDFTQGEALDSDQLRAVEDRVNQWIAEAHPVRWLEMARDEAIRLGAMALFGEKYGDWVRVVEVEQVSRELCGGTHVANTAEVGIFRIPLLNREYRSEAGSGGGSVQEGAGKITFGGPDVVDQAGGVLVTQHVVQPTRRRPAE